MGKHVEYCDGTCETGYAMLSQDMPEYDQIIINSLTEIENFSDRHANRDPIVFS